MIKYIVYTIAFAVVMISINYCKTHRNPVSADAQNYMPQISKGVNQVWGGPICIAAGPFPIEITPTTNFISGCLNCGKLFKAGMLEKTYPHDFNDPHDYVINITDLGLNFYTNAIPGRTPDNELSGFCFGDAKLDKVVAALPMEQFMGQSAISIKFKMKVENPDPFLLLPESKELGYPYLPLKALDGTSDHVETTTVKLKNNEFLELDSSLRYGEWLNE
ncbi:hypothetical protein [uncultured Tolumonas sp.]|uniref:hypothetical protein n=1 Tax=uncultured Tolumonas sp. TaxID=263765 RepID=UPI002A0A4470|nr:hypothetical protein [uncultured Tolumonas sp.]